MRFTACADLPHLPDDRIDDGLTWINDRHQAWTKIKPTQRIFSGRLGMAYFDAVMSSYLKTLPDGRKVFYPRTL
jgi:hypothetical protein